MAKHSFDSESPLPTNRPAVNSLLRPELTGWRFATVVLLAGLALAGVAELWMGRSLFGPDGHFGFWAGNTHSSECSQRLFDPYSFSHIAHGILFYALFWLLARQVPVPRRFCAAVGLEVVWEIVENSSLVIQRYRQATMALGYDGDSVLNSMSDIVMMGLGFLIAWRVRSWASVALLVAMEVACALWIRDNLTLNVIMLLHPVAGIKSWQMGGVLPF